MDCLNKNIQPDKKLAAVCGLYCPSCTLFIGTNEDLSRLELMAKRMGRSVDELTCNGCRSDKRSFFCANFCKMSKCALEKGIEFCGACAEYPCEHLKTFQSLMPHRLELWESLKSIDENGYEKWFNDMTEHHSCPKCGTINSAYDLKCRECDNVPSSQYFKLHEKKILEHLDNTRK
jgi:hypothetical protein